MGDPSPILTSLVFDIWQWCLQRQIHLSAQHIPGLYNLAADEESRMDRDSSDWKLDPLIFSQIDIIWGSFRGRPLCNPSHKPTSSMCELDTRPKGRSHRCIHTKLVSDKTVNGAFPPFNLVGKCLSQVRDQKVDQLCIITPVWETRPWYPLLL